MKMLKILGITIVFLSNFGATVHASEEEDNSEGQINSLEHETQSERPDLSSIRPQILGYNLPPYLPLISVLMSILQSSRFEQQNSMLQREVFQPLQELSNKLEGANFSEEVKNELKGEIYKTQEQYQQVVDSVQRQDLKNFNNEAWNRLDSRENRIFKLTFRVRALQNFLK